jgi:dolichyl-phosphate-mannose--protein O-mannosyl transferase
MNAAQGPHAEASAESTPSETAAADPPRGVARAWPYVLLLAVSALLHFAWYGHPAAVVFDEVYFPRFALAYLRHEYFLDLHPPLGKLIFFATAWLAGLDPGFSFASIHLPFPDPVYAVLRVPPSLAGTLLPLVLVGIALELGLSRFAALAVGALAALDNGLLALTRFATTDAFLLLFGFGALWCGLRGRARGWRWLVAAGLLGGAALSVKWTGFAFVGLLLLGEALRTLRGPRPARAAGALRIVVLAALAASVYAASFAAHFALTTRTSPDAAHLSPSFQATLEGHPRAADPAQPRLGLAGRFVEMHQHMLAGHTGASPHPYASRWYDWPFMMRAVAMWTEAKDGRIASIHLLGNPAAWWASGYCILLLLVNFPPRLLSRALRRPGPGPTSTEATIVVAYLANLLPFVPIARPMFIYHYMAALCVALIGVGYLLDRCGRDGRWLGAALLVLAAAAFVYFAPLTYGLPLPLADFEARMWLRGWR